MARSKQPYCLAVSVIFVHIHDGFCSGTLVLKNTREKAKIDEDDSRLPCDIISR